MTCSESNNNNNNNNNMNTCPILLYCDNTLAASTSDHIPYHIRLTASKNGK